MGQRRAGASDSGELSRLTTLPAGSVMGRLSGERYIAPIESNMRNTLISIRCVLRACKIVVVGFYGRSTMKITIINELMNVQKSTIILLSQNHSLFLTHFSFERFHLVDAPG